MEDYNFLKSAVKMGIAEGVLFIILCVFGSDLFGPGSPVFNMLMFTLLVLYGLMVGIYTVIIIPGPTKTFRYILQNSFMTALTMGNITMLVSFIIGLVAILWDIIFNVLIQTQTIRPTLSPAEGGFEWGLWALFYLAYMVITVSSTITGSIVSFGLYNVYKRH